MQDRGPAWECRRHTFKKRTLTIWVRAVEEDRITLPWLILRISSEIQSALSFEFNVALPAMQNWI